MLSKEVCRICQEKYINKCIAELEDTTDQTEYIKAYIASYKRILEDFESYWKVKTTFCPVKILRISTDSNPPEKCHYFLEQIVSAEYEPQLLNKKDKG